MRSIKVLAINLLVLIWLIGTIEFFYYLKGASEKRLPWPSPEFDENRYEGLWSKKIVKRDSILGKSLNPNVRVVQTKVKVDKSIDVVYSTDSLGRRVSLNSDPKVVKNFGLFLGCSFTFGEGVADFETLPSFFSRASETVHSYNYGVSGYGPNNVLALLENRDLKSDVSEEKGFAIYTFINDHIYRAIGSRSKSTGWWSYNPYYVLNESEGVVRQGNFTENRWLTSGLYYLLSFSNFVNYYNLEFPLSVSQDDVRFTSALLAKIKKRYSDQFKNENFFILFYPGANFAARIKAELVNSGIKFLDYSNYKFSGSFASTIEGDSHPTSAAYHELAQEILKDSDFRIEN